MGCTLICVGLNSKSQIKIWESWDWRSNLFHERSSVPMRPRCISLPQRNFWRKMVKNCFSQWRQVKDNPLCALSCHCSTLSLVPEKEWGVNQAVKKSVVQKKNKNIMDQLLLKCEVDYSSDFEVSEFRLWIEPQWKESTSVLINLNVNIMVHIISN